MTVPVWLTVPQFDHRSDLLLDLCRRSSSWPIAGLVAFDHLIPVGDATRPVLEGAATLGAIAGWVRAPKRMGSLVLRVTLRAPTVTAAVAETLSMVAAGRPMIGLGVGDRFSAEEGERFGMSPPALEGRLRMLTETIASIRRRVPNAEIWVGGVHPLVRKAALQADGWNAWGVTPSELARMGPELRAFNPTLKVTWGGGLRLVAGGESGDTRGGRQDKGSHPVLTGSPPEIVDELSRRAQLVDELVVSVLPNRPETWDLFAASVLPQLP